MDSTLRTRTVQYVVKNIEKNNILLTHKLQRPEGQWSKKQKADLIDSLLIKMPINPTYAIKENGQLFIIDGVQRMSTLRDLCNDTLKMPKNMAPVVINGVEKNLAGLKFSQMDEDVQEAIMASEIHVYELSDCTEADVRKMFERQNAGKPLTSKLMRVVYESDEFTSRVYALTEHPFMKKIVTNTQHKNGTDRALIVQTLMLICTNEQNNFTSFRAKDIDNFVITHGDEVLDKFDTLTEAMDRLDTSFETIKIPVTSIPMMLYAGYRVFKNKGSFTKLVDVINNFVNSYDNNEEYKLYLQSATTSSESVAPRLEYWKGLIKDL